ncbi:hypothetical protein GALMADRAFT_226117 [Galerina marginata CBS 339.88]|uniref:BTB domain-containing protein n=1 Tax=Galerina marginata (strain CBS 339.88) TaxID=685588 RepID=A0A067SX32_GALM3|nr:hypothetical protein GALMADRAFT_226117 [Galerina marginata CBS 339.88]
MSLPNASGSAASGSNSGSASRDAAYFLEPVVFKVEDALFQVPRHHFAANPVFSTIFTLSPPEGSPVEGSSEANPFVLERISKKDFQAFLSVLYPLTIPHSYSNTTAEEWKSVLVLSTMWEFQSLRDLAVQTLGSPGVLDPVSKILLGAKHDIPEWFISGCVELVTRPKGPRAEEVDLLGADTAIKIYDLREGRIEAQIRRYNFDARARVKAEFQNVLGP